MVSGERLLEGKVVVVTGSSRGIGREILLQAASLGAKVVGNSVDDSKSGLRRVEQTMARAGELGGEVKWAWGDITSEEGQATIFNTALEYGQQTDCLFLNAAGGLEINMPDGWAEKINIDSQLDLVRRFSSLMSPHGAIIYETSLWAKHFGQVKQLPFYRPVSRTKYVAEKRLREMAPDLAQNGIRVGFLCGHLIKDTAAYALFSRAFPDRINKLRQQFQAATDREDFPTAEEMARAGIELALSNFDPGKTAYVGFSELDSLPDSQRARYILTRREIRRKLPMYSESKLLVDGFISPEEDEFGYAKETGVGSYGVRTRDTNGHFRGRFRDIKVFRGVDQIEAAAQAIGLVFLGIEPDLGVVPFFRKIGEVEFAKMAFTSEVIDLYARLTSINSQGIRGNCEIRIGDEIISVMEGIELGLVPSIERARRIIAIQKAARQK